MPLGERAGHAIHYDVLGDPSAPPLLLIMGLALSSRAWDTFPRRLAESFRVIVFDNRGTGRSGRKGWIYRMPGLADDAAAVLDATRVAKADVFGISLGGMIAQELRHATTRRLAQIRAPTLVLTGDADRLVPPRNSEALARAIPGAKLLVLPGAGHAFPLEREEETVRALAGHFLDASGVAAT